MSTFKIDKITAITANSNIIIQGEGTGKVSLGDGNLLFPDSDGSSGQVIQTDGSGTLSWTTDSVLTDEQVQDTVGAMLSGNTESGINVTYQDSDGTIDFAIGTLNQDTTGTADNFTVTANNATNETVYPVFVDSATGSQGAESDTGLTYNPSTNILTTTTFSGALSGNATTSTTLQTARTIGGVSFNGSANINLPGVNIAGNQDTTGTAATVTGAAQSAITSLGTLTTLSVDNITIDANTISSTAGVDLLITPLTGQQIVLDGTIVIDAGVVTGATSITSTAFVGALTGNASTATTLENARTVGMTGDVVWTSTGFDGSGNVTGTATIQANSVTLGTDTTGNYVATVSGTSNEIEVSGSGGETAGVTIGLPDNVTIGGALTVTGDLTVNGATTTISTTNIVVEDTLLELNTGAVSNANDMGLIMERGSTGDNAIFMWDESADKFTLGTTTAVASATGNIVITTGTLVATLEGNATTSTTLQTARTIGGVSFNGSANINLPGVNIAGNQDTTGTAATVTGAAQSAITSLGTLTTLSVDNITINGNTISSTAGVDLNITPLTGQQIVLDGTIVIDAGVVTGATSITSTAFVGALTGNSDTATTLDTGRTIGMTGDVVWTSTSFNGSGNVTGTATIQPNSVDGTMIALGSDVSGDVMYYNGTNYVRLAKGSDTEVLTLTSGIPSWTAAAAGGESAFTAQSAPGVTPTATGTDAIAIGDGAVSGDATTDLATLAIGARSSAIGISAIAIGENSDATGANSIAIGGHTTDLTSADATATDSIAIGTNTLADADYTIALGRNADAGGIGGIAMSFGSSAVGAGSISIGRDSNVTGAQAIAIGENADANGANSIAIGGASTDSDSADATVSGAIAVGMAALASGTQSVAIGKYTDASGADSIAIGGGATDGASANATAIRAVAIGNSSIASAQDSVALGYSTLANSNSALAIGYNSKAQAERAISIGRNSKANGINSVALGEYSKSVDGGQFAFATGRFVDDGDAQTSIYVLRNTTTNATQTELFADGSAADISIPNDSTIMFKASIVARRTDADNESAAYIIEGCIDNNAGTVALVGNLGTKTILSEDTTTWDVTITADNTNNGINVLVTGDAAKTIRWVAKVEVTLVAG